VVHRIDLRGFQVAGKKGGGGRHESGRMVRASASFPRDLYRTLEQLARQKKVSVAWVVREAAEQYVAQQWPLFGKE
jgi:hypothetical protein